MRRVLGPAFFRRSGETVAKALLGKHLVRKIGRKEQSACIVETEAYHGFDDLASHAHRGKTPRNAPMFQRGGVWYVYFTYGMHWLLNAVTSRDGLPSAVLIRAVEGLPGPARITKTFRIGRAQNGRSIGRATGLWIEDRGKRVPSGDILRVPRVGISYAGTWAQRPLRFVWRQVDRTSKRP